VNIRLSCACISTMFANVAVKLVPKIWFAHFVCGCCRRGVPSNQFTLILQGRVLIHTGAEDFELELGPWSVLGQRAMVAARFVPVSSLPPALPQTKVPNPSLCLLLQHYECKQTHNSMGVCCWY
jgi:hypothetical protein